MSRILFITSTRIGDAILSTGLLKYLVDQHPQAHFTIATGEVAAPLFAAVPRLERVIIVRKQPYKRHWIWLWRQCAGTRWDQIIDLRRSAIGYLLRTQAYHRLPTDSANLARVPYLASTLKLDPPAAPYLWIPTAAIEAAKQDTHQQHPLIVLAPIANWAPKQWPAERFVTLVDQLKQRCPKFANAHIAISAAAHERSDAISILTQISVQGHLVHDWIGKGLLETAALLQCADLFVGNDSGLMHMAAAVGTPTIGLFGPTNVTQYAPWGAHCQSVVSTNGQMDGIMVSAVLDKIGVLKTR